MRKILIFFVLIVLFCPELQAQQEEKKTDLYNAIKSEIDPVIKESYLLQMDSTSSMYEYSKSLIICAYAESGNVEKVNSWINTIKGDAAKYTAIYSAISSYISVKKLDEAENLILPIINTDKGKTFRSTLGNNLEFNLLYGLILFERGNYSEVLKYLTPSAPKSMHEKYAISMVKAGNPQKAIEEIKEELLKPGDKNEKITGAAREIFIKIYGDDLYYKKYIDSIAVVIEKNLINKISEKMINTPSPDFSITDMNGRAVSLQSLKGKTVIMDFWATWCEPCVGSFPAMQKLVNYFSKDTSVVFMFIHTAERSNNAADEAKKILSARHYTFNLFMDLRDPVIKKNPLSEIFDIEYLPTKIIIDRNGNIRFKETGYINEYEGYEETKAMIEQVMNNK